MTKRECAIVSLYTGYLVGSFSEMHKYAEELYGEPIWTHQFPDLMDKLHKLSKQDFINLSLGVTE